MSSSDGARQASLTVGRELRDLSRVTAWVHDWAEREHLPSRVVSNLDLCSTEVVTNIMNHARSQVQLSVEHRSLVVHRPHPICPVARAYPCGCA